MMVYFIFTIQFFIIISESITMDSIVGTPLFMAPEVIKQKYNEKCDN